jgi:hypothetical protein
MFYAHYALVLPQKYLIPIKPFDLKKFLFASIIALLKALTIMYSNIR